MLLKHGIDTFTLQPEMLNLVSTKSDRICLSFIGKPWGDMICIANGIAIDAAPTELYDFEHIEYKYNDLVSDEKIHFCFTPQNGHINRFALIVVKTRWGATLEKKVMFDISDSEIACILDAFFENGSKGMRPYWIKYFETKYRNWKESIM